MSTLRNVLKVQDTEGNIIAELGINNNAKENYTLTSELIKVGMEKQIGKVVYPAGMPKNQQGVIGMIEGVLNNLAPKATIQESKTFDWVKGGFGGEKADWDSDEYWDLRGYNPEKDPGGEYRNKAIELREAVRELDKLMRHGGVVDMKAKFDVYFQTPKKDK